MKKCFTTVLLTLVFSVCAYAAEFPIVGVEEAKQLSDGKAKGVLADVRTAKEYAEGHIPGAVSVPYGLYYAITKYLPKDKNTLIVFYCRGTS